MGNIYVKKSNVKNLFVDRESYGNTFYKFTHAPDDILIYGDTKTFREFFTKTNKPVINYIFKPYDDELICLKDQFIVNNYYGKFSIWDIYSIETGFINYDIINFVLKYYYLKINIDNITKKIATVTPTLIHYKYVIQHKFDKI